MAKPLHLFGPNPLSLTVKGANQVFDYSRMMGRFFEPDEKICLIFDNVHYGKLRQIEEFSWKHNPKMRSLKNELRYADMPCAREWAD